MKSLLAGVKAALFVSCSLSACAAAAGLTELLAPPPTTRPPSADSVFRAASADDGGGGDVSDPLRNDKPADIIDKNLPNDAIDVAISGDNSGAGFVWEARDSAFEQLTVRFTNAAAPSIRTFSNITLRMANIKCFNDPNTNAQSPKACIHIAVEEGIKLSNVKVIVDRVSTRNTCVTSSFTNTLFDGFAFSVANIEDVRAHDHYLLTAFRVDIIGEASRFTEKPSSFSFSNITAKLGDRKVAAHVVRFVSQHARLEGVDLSFDTIENEYPSSNEDGDAAMGILVKAPSADLSAISFSKFKDVFVKISGYDATASTDDVEMALSYRSTVSFSDVHTTVPAAGTLFDGNVVSVMANFDRGSTLTVANCNWTIGGGSLRVGVNPDRSAHKAVLNGGSSIFVSNISGLYAGSSQTRIVVNAVLNGTSSILIANNTNVYSVRVEEAEVSHRSSIIVEGQQGTYFVSVDGLSLCSPTSVGGCAAPHASLVVIRGNTVGHIHAQSVNTTGGFLEVSGNAPLASQQQQQQKNAYPRTLMGLTGLGFVSDINNAHLPIVLATDFEGSYELWGNTFDSDSYAAEEGAEPLIRNISFVVRHPYPMPRRILLSNVATSIRTVLSGDFEWSVDRSKLLKRTEAGCGALYTYNTYSKELLAVVPDQITPPNCEVNATLRRCGDEGSLFPSREEGEALVEKVNPSFWFFAVESVNRSEYVLRSEVESCLSPQRTVDPPPVPPTAKPTTTAQPKPAPDDGDDNSRRILIIVLCVAGALLLLTAVVAFVLYKKGVCCQRRPRFNSLPGGYSETGMLNN